MLAKLRSEQHWHANETRWAVFVPREGKVGHRGYLWVYHSPSVAHYVLDSPRSARVIEDELGEVACGIISCDALLGVQEVCPAASDVPAGFLLG